MLFKFLQKNVFAYNKDNLSDYLRGFNNNQTPFYSLLNKTHLIYIYKYFDESNLNAKFVYVETDYISKNYLTDYSNYYSSCFADYKRKCTRLHFFSFNSNLISHFLREFEYGIKSKEKDEFWDKYYLGFFVINPIPNTFIGYTLLKHKNCFNSDKSKNFWGTKIYDAHLFGIKVPIESLAFHEQDSNVGACATIAIWSVFQIASEDYYVNLKSPVEITKDAGLINHHGQRMFPNDGLIPEAICTAITKNNLVTEVRNFDNLDKSFNSNSYLKKLINAYSTICVPIILGIRVPYLDNLEPHAIAICGHKEEEIHGILHKNNDNISWKADYLTEIYANDDQWGPFVEIPLINNHFLKTPWSDLDKTKRLSVLKTIIIPVFPKVRIYYDQIEALVVSLNRLLLDTLKFSDTFFLWDIQLHYSENYKRYIKNLNMHLFVTTKQSNRFKYTFLSKSLPKYVWISTLYLYNPETGVKKEFFGFVFDATGLVETRILLHVLCFIPKMRKGFIDNIKKLNIENEGIEEYFEIYDELFDGVLNIKDFII